VDTELTGVLKRCTKVEELKLSYSRWVHYAHYLVWGKCSTQVVTGVTVSAGAQHLNAICQQVLQAAAVLTGCD